MQKSRTERVEDGGKRTVIVEQDNRVIIKQDNRVIIHHDEAERFRRAGQDVRSQKRSDGTTETVVVRPGGVQLFSVTDGDGRLVRRYRRDARGAEINIIDNRSFLKPRDVALGVGIGVLAAVAIVALAPPAVSIPREKYVVDYERASPDDLYEALSAPPVDRLERAYSLEEIRYSHALRERMRRIDLDTVNFESGAWSVDADQYPKLERVARAMLRVIDRHPEEVFLIEGHTDAVGSDIDNLSLSDRRAATVADVLTGTFGVPPENLVTQGYGEEFLKVPTQGPERANRRVAIRRITPLMAHAGR